MKKPDPVPGMVVRYDFLWGEEQKRGRVEGSKDRPCAIVVVAADTGHVLVVPITHTQHPAESGIELPPKVKENLGLDDARSWIVLNEINRVRWDDAGIVPATPTRWDYGALPQSLLMRLQQEIAEMARKRRVAIMDRKVGK